MLAFRKAGSRLQTLSRLQVHRVPWRQCFFQATREKEVHAFGFAEFFDVRLVLFIDNKMPSLLWNSATERFLPQLLEVSL